jgi:hypothetical protein
MGDRVGELQDEIDALKVKFNAARRRLSAVLAPAIPKQDAESVFLFYADEFSLEKALEDAQKDPDYFDLSVAPDAALALKVSEPLKELHELNQTLINLVAERENILIRKNPAHKPCYFVNGREVTIDPKMETITYLDTGKTYAFVHDQDTPRPTSSPARERSR